MLRDTSLYRQATDQRGRAFNATPPPAYGGGGAPASLMGGAMGGMHAARLPGVDMPASQMGGALAGIVPAPIASGFTLGAAGSGFMPAAVGGFGRASAGVSPTPGYMGFGQVLPGGYSGAYSGPGAGPGMSDPYSAPYTGPQGSPFGGEPRGNYEPIPSAGGWSGGSFGSPAWTHEGPGFGDAMRGMWGGGRMGLTGHAYQALTGEAPNPFVNFLANMGLGMIPGVGTGLSALNTLGGAGLGLYNTFNNAPDWSGAAGAGQVFGTGAYTNTGPDILLPTYDSGELGYL